MTLLTFLVGVLAGLGLADVLWRVRRARTAVPDVPDDAADIPDGEGWREHLTHDLRWDEESPLLRMPEKVRRPE